MLGAVALSSQTVALPLDFFCLLRQGGVKVAVAQPTLLRLGLLALGLPAPLHLLLLGLLLPRESGGYTEEPPPL